MILLIDVGNTRIKWVLQATHMSGLDNVQTSLTSEPLSEDLKQTIQQADAVWISCVAGAEMKAQLTQACVNHAQVHWVQASAEIHGLQSAYQPPESLGVDRWCGLVAVWHQYRKTALVVSLGTAVTIDALLVKSEAQAEFIGGSIQPGLQLMLDSLHQGTAQLPSIHPMPALDTSFAQNTTAAMGLGCLSAILGAIQLQYQTLAEITNVKPLLIITGGDAALVKAYLPNSLAQVSVFVDNLALTGLLVLAGIAE